VGCLEDTCKVFKDGTGKCELREVEGLLLRVLYLYLGYDYTNFVLNGWVGGSRLWLSVKLYCFHSHCNLVSGMMIRCRPISS
jgi:hypothetical protein